MEIGTVIETWTQPDVRVPFRRLAPVEPAKEASPERELVPVVPVRAPEREKVAV